MAQHHAQEGQPGRRRRAQGRRRQVRQIFFGGAGRGRLTLRFALAVAAAAFALSGSAQGLAGGFALTGVHVVDVLRGRIVPNQTIVIAGGRIVAVQDAAAPLGRGLERISSAGKYVIPGLWDMHVHIADARYMAMFVRQGVVGVRDMGGGLENAGDGCESLKPAVLRRWRSEIAAGSRVGPELVISGPAVSGTGWPTSLPARSPAEAGAAVRALKRERVDFLKVYERIPRAAYKALATGARRSGLPIAGHVPEEVGPLLAIRSGQRSIEHVRDALLVCFAASPAEAGQFFAQDGWGKADIAWGRAAYADCPAIVAALPKRATWLTPTLTVEKAKVDVENPVHVGDARRRFLPQSVQDGYAAYATAQRAQSPADRASAHLWWRTQQKLVRRMNRAGVKLLAGTDTACEGGLPGHSLHAELRELAAAGLSTAQALRSATLEPARYLGRSNEGHVAAGYRANLLLLDADPLANIANSARIDAVIIDGRRLDRAQLDRLQQPVRP